MLTAWFNASEVIAFAEEVADEVDKLFPLDERQNKPLNAKKEQKKLGALLIRVRAFSSKVHLNIYKKAKFLNTVKWTLRDAGHDEQFVNDVVALFATSLNS
jgi:hypothetical protein